MSQPHALSIGHMLELTREYPTPWGPIPDGTKCYVEEVHDDDGTAVLFVEGAIPALFNWRNRLVIVPFATNDLLECMVCGLRSIKPIQATVVAITAQLRTAR